ncbi:MAG: transglutaminase-like domain-containing protein [Oscillospiraceae bacterium]|nr:transglutaminase-like domain-containing protein [Oscillospiraceae bacterium]
MRKSFWAGMLMTAATLAALLSVQAWAADIDTSTSSDGYITASQSGGGKIKVQVEKDGVKYNYNLNNSGRSEAFPLQMGDGTYTVKVLENVGGNKYAVLKSTSFSVSLTSPLAPYLVPTQMVNYSDTSTTVTKAAELVTGKTTKPGKVESVYNYVVDNISYDANKAATVTSGYIPSVDSVLSAKTGICFDYAAVTAAMLRSQGIPTRLVTGYVSPANAYHAWNEVYLDEAGWVNVDQIYFDGSSWKRMDPTFASSGKSGSSILQYIGNGANYTKKYTY